MFKAGFAELNRRLTRYNGQSQKQSMWNFLHRWDYQHTWVKNILKITNKILKGFNKYHVFRWDWIVGPLGCAAGFIVNEMEDAYYNARVGFKPMVSTAVISGVLQNDTIKHKLKTVLNQNVFTNQEIQYYVHQALLNQVLHPQKDNIKLLIKSAIASLNQPSTHQALAQSVAPLISKLKQPIGNAALDFLNSKQMDEIAANGLCSVLQSLYIKNFMGEQAKYFLNGYLKDKNNVDGLYSGLRQNFIF